MIFLKKILYYNKMVTYMTFQELRKMAVGKKIKNAHKFSKVELAKELNLDEEVYNKPSNAREVLITNVETQVVTKCKSIYQCSKVVGKSYGSTHYFINCGNEFLDKDGNKVRLSFA